MTTLVTLASGAIRGLAIALVIGAMSACGGAAVRGQGAGLRVVLEPDTARVYVDDRFVGTGRVLTRSPAVLAPGAHLVTVSAPGYFPHDVRVELPLGVTTMRLSLRAIPR